MRIFSFRYNKCENGVGDPCEWRWTFDVGLRFISFNHEYRVVGDDEWSLASMYYNVSFTNHFRLGRSHAYYDGPHDVFSLGFIHFNWSGDRCLKCEGET